MKKICVVLLVLMAASVAVAADVTELFTKSYALEASGDYSAALAVISDAYNAKLDTTVKYTMKMRLGFLDVLLKKYEDAAVQYGDAAELMPKAVEPLLYQSYELYLLKEWKKLQDVCLKALNLDPKNYYARVRLAYAYCNLADYSASLREYQKVIELFPADLEVKAMIGWNYAYMKDKTKATQYFQEVLNVYPSSESAKAGVEYLKKI